MRIFYFRLGMIKFTTGDKTGGEGELNLFELGTTFLTERILIIPPNTIVLSRY